MISIIVSVLALGALIFVHELGHFIIAKLKGIGVLEFAIGFGPKVASLKFGETLYSLRIFPLGGFVRMVGEDPEELESVEEEGKQLKEDQSISDRSRWFLLQGYWTKVAVVFAGPASNLLFAFVLSIASFMVFGVSEPVDIPKIGDVIPGQPAEKAGFKPGDLVKSVDGVEIRSWEELAKTVAGSKGRELRIIVEREEEGHTVSKEITVQAEKEMAEIPLVKGEEREPSYKIGVISSFERRWVSFKDATILGALHVYTISAMTVRGLYGMVRGFISPTHLAGPIFIFNEAARTAKKGVEYLIDFVIFLSVSLAILNLLPIPVLDGGHLLLFTIEALKGDRLNVRTQMVATQLGLLFLLLLTFFAVTNDIRRLF